MSDTQLPGVSTGQPSRRSRRDWFVAGGLVLLAALGLYTANAFAQRGYGPDGWGGGYGWRGGPGMMEGGPGWRGGHHGGPGMRGERFTRFCSQDTARWQPVARLFIKTDLRLTDPQSAAFDRLADTLLPAMEGVKAQACDNFVSRAGAAPERLQHLAAVLKKASAAADEAIAPAQAFYATLDDAQKARVDQMLERRGRWMGPR
jgi:hypothetical protein